MSSELRPGAAVERRFFDQEHRELALGIGRIEEVAGLAGSLAARDLSNALRTLLDWLQRSLRPHVEWEESWLYPEFDRIGGTPWVTRVMRCEHRQIERLIQLLEGDWEELRHEPTHRQLVDLRARLYALHFLVRSHFEKEERFLLPLLGNEVEATSHLD